MNSADYTFLLNQPAAVTDKQTDGLEKIVTEFPYFQSARALRLKGLYNQNSFQYNFALKVAAAYTTDRSVLFDFITSDTFTTIHKGLYDQKLAELHGMEVNGSEVVKQSPREPQPVVDLVEASILTSIKESQTPFADESAPAGETPSTHESVIEITDGPAESVQPVFAEIPATDAFEEIGFVPTPEPDENGVGETSVNENLQQPADDEKSLVSQTGQIQQPEENSTQQTAEKNLNIGEPLAFSKTETHSFQQWLQLSKIQPIQREEAVEDNRPENNFDLKVKKNALIDRFIETNPKIPPMKPDAPAAAVPQQKDDHSALMTETLARVYLEQKKYQKAIQAYEILILKYPEKSSFFADRISEIKNLQQNT